MRARLQPHSGDLDLAGVSTPGSLKELFSVASATPEFKRR
jgi:hypothetical protein